MNGCYGKGVYTQTQTQTQTQTLQTQTQTQTRTQTQTQTQTPLRRTTHTHTHLRTYPGSVGDNFRLNRLGTQCAPEQAANGPWEGSKYRIPSALLVLRVRVRVRGPNTRSR